MRRRRPAVLAALLLTLAATPGAARAEMAIVPDSFTVAALDAGGQPELRAGAHPDRLVTRFAFSRNDDGSADGNVRDAVIDLPPGFAGDPAAAPACGRSTFVQGACDPSAQVGVLTATFAAFGGAPLTFPLYNIVPTGDEFAEFGATVFIIPVRFRVRLREESDYGLQIRLTDVSEGVPLLDAAVELWGVPADHQSGTGIPRRSLLTNPTRCGEQPQAVLHARSWEAPDRWLEAAAPSAGPLTGCDQLTFAASLSAALDTPVADTPSGLALDVALPQEDDPDGLAASQAAGLTAALPGGLTLSPGVASGLASCDDAAFGVGSASPPRCPDAAKLGTVELTTPVLPEPLTGGIYLGRPLPSDRFRLFVAAAGRGLALKLTGSLRPDPDSGQVSLALDDLPALTFDHLRLHFKDGPRAPLATPPSCGPGAVTLRLAARRGGDPVRRAAVLEVTGEPGGRACALTAPFAPAFAAGSTRAAAGGSAPFSVTVTRADGDQTLDRLALTLPAGVGARLASAARCPEALAAKAACPAGSRIGRVAVEAGAGPQPLPLAGDAYLTGPHAGAPFGLALVLDGRAGPLDLGTVVVLAKLELDPADARVTVTTDPLPQVVAGVPLRLRTFALDIDRPGFMRNATSCRPERTDALFTSLDAAGARATAPYTLRGCARLRFTPRVGLRVGPRDELHAGGRPAVTIALHAHPGQAALRAVTLELPRALALDPPLGQVLCTQLRARDGRCPPRSAVGTARVRTPLLPHPLTGAVDVVQPRRGTQPELWATVRSMGVRLSLRAQTSAPASGPIETRFTGLPDVPLSSLRLTLGGGADGVLQVAHGDLCAPGAASRATVRARLTGHNGAARRLRAGARLAC